MLPCDLSEPSAFAVGMRRKAVNRAARPTSRGMGGMVLWFASAMALWLASPRSSAAAPSRDAEV